MSLPDVDEVRKRIEQVKDREIRMCLKTVYLYAGRISEVVGASSPSDKTLARGPIGKDVRFDTYVNGPIEEPAVIFTVRTAKRNGLRRLVALPLNYEPWAKEVADYFLEFGPSELVFPFTRQKVSMYAREKGIFDGLIYPIEEYRISVDGSIVKVPSHTRPYTIHAIRHSRTTELVEYYGFDGFNLAAYCGWTLSTSHGMFGMRVPRMVSRYLYLNWQGYFPKLLKKRFG